MDTLGVYVQVPFCASKCTFCNFSSEVAPEAAFDGYVAAVQAEAARLPEILGEMGVDLHILDLPVDTIYFGGGTPSLLGLRRLRAIVRALKARFSLSRQVEFTIEVAPGSADEAWLDAATPVGINRLSIGAQSFDDRELASVGRLHSAADTRRLTEAARAAGFRNISLDLIAGLPGQTWDSWRDTVDCAVTFGAEHISVYLFEIDDRSRLGREVLDGGARYGAATVPGDDFMADAYEHARLRLDAAGYVQYEISNFCRPGYESRHNRKYWELKPYLGLGAGAHSFDGSRRWSNRVHPAGYADTLAAGSMPVAMCEAVLPNQQIEEFFFLGLRMAEGVLLDEGRRRFGRDRLALWEAKIAELLKCGCLELDCGKLRLPPALYVVSNEILQEFVSVEPLPAV